MTWVYIASEPGLWTVGFYGPESQWNPDSDYDNREAAAERCALLNGGSLSDGLQYTRAKITQIVQAGDLMMEDVPTHMLSRSKGRSDWLQATKGIPR